MVCRFVIVEQQDIARRRRGEFHAAGQRRDTVLAVIAERPGPMHQREAGGADGTDGPRGSLHPWAA